MGADSSFCEVVILAEETRQREINLRPQALGVAGDVLNVGE